MTTGVVDENAAHDLCGDTKEVRAAAPVGLPSIDEPQVRFVDHRCRLQAVPVPLVTQLARRSPRRPRSGLPLGPRESGMPCEIQLWRAPMQTRVVILAAITLVAFSTPAVAQGLADLARAAEAARKTDTDKPAVKVYTNKDLPAVEGPAPGTAAAGNPAAADSPSALPPAPVEEPSSTESPASEPGETYWRERMRPLKERLDRNRALTQDARRRADALMRSADRCFQVGTVCAEYTESLRLSELHDTLLAEVKRDERAVFALEEEARRAGVPPGWLRP
jgi:hypothetical protein